MARGAPLVSHIFFTDDNLLFFRANQHEAHTVKGCLTEYCSTSGQAVNYDKSSIIFNTNSSTDMRELVAVCFGVRITNDFGRYLGLPSVLGCIKSAIFCFIEHRVRERVGNWRHKLISKADKEVLIKSIAQALPIFTISAYLLPVLICDIIEKVMNRYWWGGGGSLGKGIHLLSWARLSTPKFAGGLEFKKVHAFNVALLAKQS